MGFSLKKIVGKKVSKIVNSNTLSYVFPLQSFYTKSQRKTPVGKVVSTALVAGAGLALGAQAQNILSTYNTESTTNPKETLFYATPQQNSANYENLSGRAEAGSFDIGEYVPYIGLGVAALFALYLVMRHK